MRNYKASKRWEARGTVDILASPQLHSFENSEPVGPVKSSMLSLTVPELAAWRLDLEGGY